MRGSHFFFQKLENNKIKNKNHKPLPSLIYDGLVKCMVEDHLIKLYELW